MPAESGIIFCLRLELEISCFDLFSLSFSSLLQQLIHLLTPWPCFHYGHATVSHTKKQLESYHSVGQKVLLSVRARHRGRIDQVFIVRGFQLTAALKPAHNATV
jgi:hypothetical protein